MTSSSVLPPSLKPIAVRGWIAVSSWLSGSGRPSRTQRLVAADRELHLARDLVLQPVGERRVVARRERADGVRGGVAADEHEAVGGISPAPGAPTETTLPQRTSTSATLVAPLKPRARL